MCLATAPLNRRSSQDRTARGELISWTGMDAETIRNNKWGQSKKAKRKMRNPENFTKKKLNLLEFDFSIRVKREEKEVDVNLKQLCDEFFAQEHLKAEKIIEEDDYGDTEYKLKLVDSSSERLQHLTTQMKFRLEEGNGEAYYRIGYEDDGNAMGLNKEDLLLSLSTLCYLSMQLKADIVILAIKTGQNGKVADITVRRRIPDKVKIGLKIMLSGSSGSGKSTLLGVLLSDKLDNGFGIARMKILNHKHEVLTGITSSLTYTVS